MSMSASSNAVTLPPGVTIAAGRETVQAGPNGQAIQGMIYTLTLANGASTSVFVPYALQQNLDYVRQLFAERIAGINAITSLGG
jgi:hypothetical protein